MRKLKFPKPEPQRKRRHKKRSISAPAIQQIFNRWIRKRDSKNGWFTCISCGKILPISKMNAGHYVPIGRSSFLRFDEDNTNGECENCNGFDKFHLVGYRKNLVAKIGGARVLWLEEHSHDLKRWTKEELLEIKKKYSRD